jgi:hypothetical protein
MPRGWLHHLLSALRRIPVMQRQAEHQGCQFAVQVFSRPGCPGFHAPAPRPRQNSYSAAKPPGSCPRAVLLRQKCSQPPTAYRKAAWQMCYRKNIHPGSWHYRLKTPQCLVNSAGAKFQRRSRNALIRAMDHTAKVEILRQLHGRKSIRLDAQL